MRILAPLLVLAAPLPAHELWLEPAAYIIPADGMLTADIVNGQTFEGINLPYLSQQSARLEVATPNGLRPISPRMGDRPAITVQAEQPGLYVLAYETQPATITYETSGKFADFARYKDAEWALTPAQTAPITETYTRHAKALICADHCTGADRAIGLTTEFVALTPPGADMRLRLLFQGAPRANARVTLFEKGPDGTTTQHLRTDTDGNVTLPTRPGFSYLADAVVFERRTTQTQWHTYWAAMTFEVHP